MHRILFITTSNLTTNPRLLKEVKLALEKGLVPTVVCFDFDNWSATFEKEQRAALTGVNFISITTKRKAFVSWGLATVFQIIYQKVHKILPLSLRKVAYASDRRSFLLERHLNKIGQIFDSIVSHNLGSLYPAYTFAKKTKTPFAFDIEDFHPGETVTIDAKNEVERRKKLMKQILPLSYYVSYASPLIGKASLDLVPELHHKRHFLVNNSFPTSEFQYPIPHGGGKLSFVWFSQNIAAGRGLELVVPILFKYRDKVQLTLIGNLVHSFYDEFLMPFDRFIKYQQPLEQQALHSELAKFDIGLAIEISNRDLNKDIAYSNKIFAYAQAGLYIMATDTKAQQHFMYQNPSLGGTFPQSEASFEAALKELLAHKEEVLAAKQQRFEEGKNLAWELEAAKLLNIWKSVQAKAL